MKIPAHLCLSRHGVYYFRQTSQKAGKQRAKKISLHTKDPSIAKQKAIELLALLNKFNGEAMTIRKFEMAFGPNGEVNFKTDKNDPDDIENLGRFLKKNPHLLPKQTPAKTDFVKEKSGMSVEDVLKKYQERQEAKLSRKTFYGYVRYITIFKDWLISDSERKKLTINHIDRKIISAYINHLREEDVNDRTIEKNYLMSLNGFFDFAKSIGEYPKRITQEKHALLSLLFWTVEQN